MAQEPGIRIAFRRVSHCGVEDPPVVDAAGREIASHPGDALQLIASRFDEIAYGTTSKLVLCKLEPRPAWTEDQLADIDKQRVTWITTGSGGDGRRAGEVTVGEKLVTRPVGPAARAVGLGLDAVVLGTRVTYRVMAVAGAAVAERLVRPPNVGATFEPEPTTHRTDATPADETERPSGDDA